jgi:hypothetical protein
MKLKLPVALFSCLAFVGCATAPVEQSNSLPMDLKFECKNPRNDRFSYSPDSGTSFSKRTDDWSGTFITSCYGHFSAAVYCKADESECSYALVNNRIHYQVEPKDGEAYRVSGYLESEYGPEVQIKTTLGGSTTEIHDKLLDGVKLIASGKQSEQFDVTLRPGEKHFVPGFAESGVTFSVSE